MIKYEDQCCGCAVPGYPCLGSSCSYRHVPVIYCDVCGNEMYDDVDGEDRCDVDRDYHVCKECEPDDDIAEDEIEYAEASQPLTIGGRV